MGTTAGDNQPSEPPVYKLPAGEAASSLLAIESFMGVRFGADGELIKLIRHLPEDRLEELQIHIGMYSFMSADALLSRRPDYGDTSVDSQQAIPSKESAHFAGRIHVCETSFDHWRTRYETPTSLSEDKPLKYLTLLGDTTLIHDPFLSKEEIWIAAEDDATSREHHFKRLRHEIITGLQSLSAVVDLVRSGTFVLADPFNVSVETEEGTSQQLFSRHPNPIDMWIEQEQQSAIKPFQAAFRREEDARQALLARANLSPADVRKLAMHERRLSRLIDDMYVAIARANSLDLRPEDILRTREMAWLVQYFGLVPVSSSADVSRLWQECTRIAWGGKPHRKSSVFRPPIQYNIPALGGIDWSDIITLRNNEAAFADVRKALVGLETVCTQSMRISGNLPDYDAYTALVTQYANDVIRPEFDKLNRRMRKLKFQERFIRTAIAFASAGIVPIITELPLIGDALHTLTDKFATGNIVRNYEANNAGATILKTIIDRPKA